MFKLIVVWDDGYKEEYKYKTWDEANKAKDGFYMAFGQQVWCAIDREMRMEIER